MLAFLWVVLPVGLPRASTGPVREPCLTLADAPPDPARTGLMTALKRCSDRHPTDVDVTADLGRLYEASDRFHDAETTYRRALSVDPRDGDLRLRLGRLLLRRGDAAAARKEATAALSVQPNRQAILDLLQKAQAR